ncbi:MAG: SprB repeat-containing protein [Bacteroidetes bacterium]|nr:SprB repeat-containing protein [Bacteroidota bacterium]
MFWRSYGNGDNYSFGGSGPYNYNWTPSGGNSASAANNLTAGTYYGNITDANGCTAVDSITITQPSQLVVNTASQPALCNGSSTGSVSVTANGGTTGYSYQWTPVGGTDSSASNLPAATYTVIVTDGNGCTTTATALINTAKRHSVRHQYIGRLMLWREYRNSYCYCKWRYRRIFIYVVTFRRELIRLQPDFRQEHIRLPLEMQTIASIQLRPS